LTKKMEALKATSMSTNWNDLTVWEIY